MQLPRGEIEEKGEARTRFVRAQTAFLQSRGNTLHARFVNKNGVKDNRCLRCRKSATLWTWRG